MRRSPLDKERFMEGNRQKWCAIFSTIGVAVMISNAYGLLEDPAPFLQFFLSIGVTFILGASATAVMNSWKVNSSASSRDTTIREDKTLKVEFGEPIPRPRDYSEGVGREGLDGGVGAFQPSRFR